VHGLPELEAAFRKVDTAARDLRVPGQAAGEQLARDVARRTPRRTGRLAGSWHVEASEQRTIVSTDVPYAPPVESGVPGRMIGAHMLEDAIDAAEDKIPDPYEKHLDDAGKAAGF
jgi:hypothetical protein